ncbi:hypothetical protein [Cognatishimia sp. MH4019]|uniref:hypothetical protein n=1 Tax=Cognatishimia sp. MH4019 TaxID=2854030 RepID=UPI001CD4EC9D|nr:hypothetical protein [Cognatishimia sp. MH4019]
MSEKTWKPIKGEDQYRQFKKHLRLVEKRLSLASGFIVNSINAGDDWSLAMKAGSVVEGAINAAIDGFWFEAIGNEKIASKTARWLKRHPVNGANGKLALSKDLGLFSNAQIKSARRIFAIRNQFAHDAALMTTSLLSVYNSLDAGQKLEIFDDFIRDVEALSEFPEEVRFRLAYGLDLMFFISNERIIADVSQTLR